MKRLIQGVCFLSIFLFLTSFAWARAPLGGLAVAVSPDGRTIVVGGDNRALYVIDGQSLNIKKRIWFKSTIWNLEFNKDGSRLLVEDTTPTIHYLDVKTWAVERELKREGYMSAARDVDLCAVKDSRGKNISFISMSDGSIKGKVALASKSATFGLNADGTKLAVLSYSVNDESERKVANKDFPKELKGVEKKEFKLKNNGKTSILYLYEAPSGKELFHKKTYYETASGSSLLFDGDSVVVINYMNENAKIDPEGEVRIFELLNSYNYGHGVSADQKRIGSGGLANGTYTMVDGLAATAFSIDKLPGWPEYFKDFAFDSEGNAYGTTTAYRLIKINPDGKVEKAVPIY